MKRIRVFLIVLAFMSVISSVAEESEFILYNGEILEVITIEELGNIYETLEIGDGYIIVEIDGCTYYVKD